MDIVIGFLIDETFIFGLRFRSFEIQYFAQVAQERLQPEKPFN
jgi:hypothetical protein